MFVVQLIMLMHINSSQKPASSSSWNAMLWHNTMLRKLLSPPLSFSPFAEACFSCVLQCYVWFACCRFVYPWWTGMKLSPGVSVLNIRRWPQPIWPRLGFKFLSNGKHKIYMYIFWRSRRTKREEERITHNTSTWQKIKELHQVRWEAGHCHFQISPEKCGFWTDQSRTFTELSWNPSRDISAEPSHVLLRVSVTPLWCQKCSGAGFHPCHPWCLYMPRSFFLESSCWPKICPWHDVPPPWFTGGIRQTWWCTRPVDDA